MMQFNIIGAGRLGMHLAYALQHSGLARLNSLVNQSLDSALKATQRLGFGTAVAKLEQLAPVPLTFITTPDSQITAIVEQLLSCPQPRNGSIFVHCSGALNAAILNKLKEQGCLIAALHPIKAFRSEGLNPNIFAECLCSIEGDSDALELLQPLFESLGAQLFTIHSAQKTLYHCAAVMASNYLVTLADLGITGMQKAGLDEALAHKVILSLMQSSLENILAAPTRSAALTGPLARGDLPTIVRHLEVLDNPILANFYRSAALATLQLTSLEEEQQQDLRALLELPS